MQVIDVATPPLLLLLLRPLACRMRALLVRGGAVWQLVGLITRRSQVQILPPLPLAHDHSATFPALFGRSNQRMTNRLMTTLDPVQSLVNVRNVASRSALADPVTHPVWLSGHPSTTPCATAQGVCDTMFTASANVAASITANPATGSEQDMKGPAFVSILFA